MPAPSRLPSWKSLVRDARVLRHGMNAWPPFLFAGIRVREVSPDFRRARVELRYHP